MADVPTRTDLITELFGIVGRFRRQLRRSADSGFDTTVTAAQAELLRLVGRRPGISVREAATELGLAPNSTSTLVSRLSADGLLDRTVDDSDRRVGRLRLTAPAQRIADRSRSARRAALSEVFDELDDRQVEHLTAGLAVLADITRKLHERQE